MPDIFGNLKNFASPDRIHNITTLQEQKRQKELELLATARSEAVKWRCNYFIYRTIRADGCEGDLVASPEPIEGDGRQLLAMIGPDGQLASTNGEEPIQIEDLACQATLFRRGKLPGQAKPQRPRPKGFG
ncbi:hypothetical protein [Gloeobacter kilaueensis]|uniref:Uncharacterized protein n=1 Tax=Gloeobacter kilaueensis (strain ATCC BAA-2537 / CCAP 1431/1 / ULC 316 / JS1) TaxID=1183438 RepID=U5QHL3_GLOK1|nr:hypothetical protein [Gloeobacter kilaueensis]AGY57160.1 hypothetical protein GKIL_0914 [Gloeobacter kilaueensis JS1]